MKRVIALLLILPMCFITLSACTNSSLKNAHVGNTTDSDIAHADQSDTETASESAVSKANVKLDLSQLQGTCMIREGNTYILEIPNDAETPTESWRIELDVGDDFDLNSITYLHCCNKYLEEKDISLSCQLESNQLIVTADSCDDIDHETNCVDEDSIENVETAISEKAYLLLESEQLSAGIVSTAHLFGHDAEKNIFEIGTQSARLQKATGDVVLHSFDGFSEGLSWADIRYRDTGARKKAIIDKSAKIIAEFDSDVYSSFGSFHNGVSLVTAEDEICQFLNTEGEVVFSSDEYGSMICGMYDGGYMFLRKTESDLSSSVEYYAIMNYKKEFIVDWTENGDISWIYEGDPDWAGYEEYEDYYLFNYFGGGVFLFMNGCSSRGGNSCYWYNAEADTFGYYGSVSGRSLSTQPALVVETSDGWLCFEEEATMYSDWTAISTTDGHAQSFHGVDGKLLCGLHSDGGYVFAKVNDNDRVASLYFYDTSTYASTKIEYEYANLIEPVEHLFFDTIAINWLELYCWPSVNMPEYFKTYSKAIYCLQSDLCELQYSKGAMLLQLHGKDGVDYYTLIDKEGNSIVEPTPGEAIATIGDGKFIVKDASSGTRHILNEKGEEVFTTLTDRHTTSAEAFHDGVARFRVDSETIAVDTDGNELFRIGQIVQEITEVGA